MTTLLPYRTPSGAVLSAVIHDEHTVVLAWALGSGPWHPFAHLVFDHGPASRPDIGLSFDPVQNPLWGLETYEWVRRLREPAYAAARRSRGTWAVRSQARARHEVQA